MGEINHKEIDERFSEAKDYDVPALLSEEFVLFPGMEIITVVNERRSQTALREALHEHQIVAFIPSSRSSSSGIGTLAIVRRARPREDIGIAGPVSEESLELKGMWRIKIKKLVESSPGYSRAVFERASEAPTLPSQDAGALVTRVQAQIDEFVLLIPQIPPEIVALLKHTNTPGELADLCANSPEFTHDEKVELLETLDQEERLTKVTRLFEKQTESTEKASQSRPDQRVRKVSRASGQSLRLRP